MFVIDRRLGRGIGICEMTYQVLTRTGNDWTNCWTNFFSDDEGEPWVFATIEEAQAEIDDLLQEMPDYDAEDYRIERVQ